MTRRHTAHFTGQELLLLSAGAEEPRWPSAMHALSHCAHIGLCARAHWVVRARALGYARAMGDCNAQAPRGGCGGGGGGGGARLWARCCEPGRSSSAQPRPATRGEPQVGEGGFQRPETCGRIRWRLCPCYLWPECCWWRATGSAGRPAGRARRREGGDRPAGYRAHPGRLSRPPRQQADRLPPAARANSR